MGDNPSERQGFGRLWLNRGIAAARAGKRAEAREALFRALNDESQRETAWLWLAAVSDDARQERMYLQKVLGLNPDNRYAKAGLAHLEEKVRGQSALLAELSGEGPEAQDLATPAGAGAPPVGESPQAEPPPAEKPRRAPAAPVAPKVRGALPPAPTAPQQPAKAKPSAQRPASVRQKAGAEPPGGTVSKLRQHPAPPAQPAAKPPQVKKAEKEPTGWTTDLPALSQARPDPRRATRPAEWWDTGRGQPFPARRRPRRSTPPPTLIGGHGRVALILNEAFNNHEMWTILASTMGLALLGFVLAFFFTLSLVTPK